MNKILPIIIFSFLLTIGCENFFGIGNDSGDPYANDMLLYDLEQDLALSEKQISDSKNFLRGGRDYFPDNASLWKLALYLQQNLLTSLPSTICDLPEDCTIRIDDNCIAENYDCIPDPGDQNECSSMNLINAQPADYQLFVPFPNPFNPNTLIQFTLGQKELVNLNIFDIQGRLIKSLVSNSYYPSGYYNITWDGKNNMGIQVPSGMYLYKLVSENQTITRKMVLMK